MKQSLREGRAVVGTALSLPDPFAAELMGMIGFDFGIIDMEHSPLTMSELQTMMIALRPTESTIIVRVEWNDVVKVKQILDVGAQGIIFPWISSREEAERAVATTKYPPQGIRGWGPRRAIRLNADSSEDYALNANDNVLVLGQIERAQAVDRLDEILTVPGFDGVMIGPADLSWSTGNRPGAAPELVDSLIQRTLDKCKEHKVAFGMFTGTMELAQKWLSRGGQIATVGGDVGFLHDAAKQAKQAIEKLKSEL